MYIKVQCLCVILTIYCTFNVFCTLSPTKKSKSSNKVNVDLRTGPQKNSVHELSLVNLNPSSADILRNQAAYCGPCSKKGRDDSKIVLGYVTPVSKLHFYTFYILFCKFDDNILLFI